MNPTQRSRSLALLARVLLPAALLGLGACIEGADGQSGNEEVGSPSRDKLVRGLLAGEQTILANAVPDTPADSDGAAVELGMKFRSTVAGKVTGVRFYKGAGNTGTHVGHLWSSSGAKLASVTFTAETDSAWQVARLATPVSIAPNTTYIISYYAPDGHYAGDNGGLSTAKNAGVLKGLANGEDGPNGVYRYGAGAAAPVDSYQSSNYFVDVVFRADGTSVADAGTPDSGRDAAALIDSGIVTPPTGTKPGWQLTASSTGLSGAGVDRNMLPVFSGAITAGMTLSRVKINSTVDLSTIPNVTLDRVWLRPTNSRNALIVGPGTVLKDSDLDGSGIGDGERIGIYSNTSSGTYSIQRVHITQMSIGAWLDGSGSGSMSDTYIHDYTSSGAHVDGFTRRAGTGVLTISRCRIDTSQGYVTGAFFLQDTWGDAISGITIEDSYLEGEGYVFTLSNSGAGVSFGARNLRIRSVGWGPMTTGGAIVFTQWSDVYEYDATKASAKGAPIAR